MILEEIEKEVEMFEFDASGMRRVEEQLVFSKRLMEKAQWAKELNEVKWGKYEEKQVTNILLAFYD